MKTKLFLAQFSWCKVSYYPKKKCIGGIPFNIYYLEKSEYTLKQVPFSELLFLKVPSGHHVRLALYCQAPRLLKSF